MLILSGHRSARRLHSTGSFTGVISLIKDALEGGRVDRRADRRVGMMVEFVGGMSVPVAHEHGYFSSSVKRHIVMWR